MEPQLNGYARLTLVTEAASPWLVKVDGEVLDKDDLTHPMLG